MNQLQLLMETVCCPFIRFFQLSVFFWSLRFSHSLVLVLLVSLDATLSRLSKSMPKVMNQLLPFGDASVSYHASLLALHRQVKSSSNLDLRSNSTWRRLQDIA